MMPTMNIIHVKYCGEHKRSMIQERGAVSKSLLRKQDI